MSMKAGSKSEPDLTAELKALGLKPAIRWLPDTSDPAFMERYRQQRAALAASKKSEIEWWEQQQTQGGRGVRRGDIVIVAPP